MKPRGRFIFTRPGTALLSVLAVLALMAQIAVPAVHQMHDALAVAHGASHQGESPHAHHHHHHGDAHHDHDEDADHDASQCPTCQLFASLRTFAPLTTTANGIVVAATSLTQLFSASAAPAGRIDLTAAAPRAPPVC